jgi:hypothetical protein
MRDCFVFEKTIKSESDIFTLSLLIEFEWSRSIWWKSDELILDSCQDDIQIKINKF